MWNTSSFIPFASALHCVNFEKFSRAQEHFIRKNKFTKNYQRQPTCSLSIITIFIRSFSGQNFGVKSVYKSTSIRNQNDQIYANMISRTILLVILIHASSARPIPGQKGQELSKVIFKKKNIFSKNIFSKIRINTSNRSYMPHDFNFSLVSGWQDGNANRLLRRGIARSEFVTAS